uniref:C2H2-type domain-containing protein n=1 Tax=Macrostomum lignano TaxID=282301 RepID=A0A1I8FEG8_9PLAT
AANARRGGRRGGQISGRSAASGSGVEESTVVAFRRRRLTSSSSRQESTAGPSAGGSRRRCLAVPLEHRAMPRMSALAGGAVDLSLSAVAVVSQQRSRQQQHHTRPAAHDILTAFAKSTGVGLLIAYACGKMFTGAPLAATGWPITWRIETRIDQTAPHACPHLWALCSCTLTDTAELSVSGQPQPSPAKPPRSNCWASRPDYSVCSSLARIQLGQLGMEHVTANHGSDGSRAVSPPETSGDSGSSDAKQQQEAGEASAGEGYAYWLRPLCNEDLYGPASRAATAPLQQQQQQILYACTLCSQSFDQLMSGQLHLQRNHPNEWRSVYAGSNRVLAQFCQLKLQDRVAQQDSHLVGSHQSEKSLPEGPVPWSSLRVCQSTTAWQQVCPRGGHVRRPDSSCTSTNTAPLYNSKPMSAFIVETTAAAVAAGGDTLYECGGCKARYKRPNGCWRLTSRLAVHHSALPVPSGSSPRRRGRMLPTCQSSVLTRLTVGLSIIAPNMAMTNSSGIRPWLSPRLLRCLARRFLSVSLLLIFLALLARYCVAAASVFLTNALAAAVVWASVPTSSLVRESLNAVDVLALVGKGS